MSRSATGKPAAHGSRLLRPRAVSGFCAHGSRQPAPSLLEALLAGIRACALLYRDYEADLVDGHVGGSDGSGDGSGSAGSTSNYWTLGEVSSASASAPSAAFIAAVRTQAGMAAGQL